MKLSEIKTVDEVLPFDVEVALVAFKNGKSVNLADPKFGPSRKSLSTADLSASGDLVLWVNDPDAAHNPRNITYPESTLHAFRLEKEGMDELTLFFDEDLL